MVRFGWVRGEGAESCASQQQIEDQVIARLGRDPFSRTATRSVEASVTGGPQGFRVNLFLRDPTGAKVGSRELESDTTRCDSVESAATLAIALAIDPDAALGELSRASSAPANAPVAASPPEGAKANREPQAEPPQPLAPTSSDLPPSALAVRAGVAVGLLPRAGPGIETAAEVAALRQLRLSIGAWWLPEERTSDREFGFGLTALGLGGCLELLGKPRANLAVCGHLWAGAIHAVVYGPSPAEPGAQAWAAASMAPRARFRIVGPLLVEVGAELVVPFLRTAFVVKGRPDPPLFQQAPVAAFPFLGLGASFF